MTIVFRPASPPSLVDLGRCGVCRTAVGEVVGVMGSGVWRVEYLTPTTEERSDDPPQETEGRPTTAEVRALPRGTPPAPGVLVCPL